jgi:cobalamin synthase
MLARRMIGGYNGDTLGATQQVAETIILVGIAASFSTA